jgi:uncharacterized repeat protein (TIGR01451 family)
VETWGSEFPVEQADASFLGENEWDFLSYYVATAGDVNADGLDDFLISATQFEEDLPCPPGTPPEDCGSCCNSSLNSAEIFDPAGAITGTWTTAPALTIGRFDHTTVLLSDGSVLVAGGQNIDSFLGSTEVFDPGAGAWTTTGSLSNARSGHHATLLPDDSVLVTGGQNDSGFLETAELFDPISGTWSTAGNPATARLGHSATLLPDGRVLVAGGQNDSGFLNTAELFDPISGTWSTTGALATARSGHSATPLPDGTVLVAGGQNDSGFLNTAEIFEPASGTWSTTGNLATSRSGHSATLLPGVSVLVAGGQNDSGFLRTSELLDLTSGSWTTAGSMNSARSGFSVALQPGGKVFAVGGQSDGGSEVTTEFFDPETQTWTKSARLNTGRTDPGMVLLPDGSPLVVGGRNCTNFGKIYLILGRSEGDWGTDFDLKTADASFLGEAAEDRIGRSVVGVGDVNGDGYDDFLIGSVSSDYGGVDAGQSYLFLGRAAPDDPGYDPARPWWGTEYAVVGADASFVGESAGDESGRRVASAGDVNNDGYDDFLVGAARHATAGYWAGIAHLILGRSAADWGMRFSLAGADASFLGEERGDQAGRRLSGAGDVNNDGYDDFLIGAPHNSRGGEIAGSAYLLYGRSTTDWGRYYRLSQADVIHVGKPEIGVAGYDVGWLGDFDGDGLDDFLIAAYGGRNNVQVPGETYVLLGGEASRPFDYTPGAPLDYQGWRRFESAYWDPNHWQDMATVYMVLGRSETDPMALNAKYEVAGNLLYLWSDGQGDWIGPCAPGDPARLSSDSVRLDCRGSDVSSLEPHLLRVQLGALWLQPIANSSNLNAYLRVIDLQGHDSGFAEFPWPEDVALRKTATYGGITRAGATLTYTLTFGNAGGATATNVAIVDIVPSELDLVGFESNYPVTPVGDVPYTWLVGDLAPMQGGTITVTAVVNPGLSRGYVFTNTATISATQPEARRNNVSSARTTVAWSAYLPVVFK